MTVPNDDGGIGGGADGSTSGDASTTFDLGAGIGSCATNASWIYLISQNNDFVQFHPDTRTLTRIGTLSCASSFGGQPFSMAVSRSATAYVLFSTSEIFAVSTTDASCTSTTYAPTSLFGGQFGMGFVSPPGSTSETLFVATSNLGLGGLGGSPELETLDTTSWAATNVGAIDGSPELTGNANGELWSFFPTTTPMSVRQLDTTNAHTLHMYDVSSIHVGTPSPTAWAFAFWGGKYYIFYQDATESQTTIYEFDPSGSGSVTPLSLQTNMTIVGAGVSTCAPLG